MSRPPIKTVKLSPTLSLSLCHADAERPDGWWLYDSVAKMNLAMGAKTEVDALVEALLYWQGRYVDLAADHRKLQKSVDEFVIKVCPSEEADE